MFSSVEMSIKIYPFVIETEVWLPASIKAKLTRQVLVKKERGLFMCWLPEKMGDS